MAYKTKRFRSFKRERECEKIHIANGRCCKVQLATALLAHVLVEYHYSRMLELRARNNVEVPTR